MKRPSRARSTRTTATDGGDIRLKIDPFGPSAEEMRAVAQAVMKHKSVRDRLARTRNRLLSIDLVEPPEETKPARPRPPTKFRAVIYDYTNNQTLLATGSLAKPASLELTESAQQPLPNREEFDEAVRLITEHAELGAGLREQRFVAYRPMPPLLNQELPNGSIERTINVGLLPREGTQGHEIVAVNMVRRNVIRFERSERGRAPATSAAHNPICGIAVDANQNTTNNAAGTVWVTVTQGGNTIWKFQALRPAASSGTNESTAICSRSSEQ